MGRKNILEKMKIGDAIRVIEEFEMPEHLLRARESVKKNLQKIPKDHFEEIGTHFYYLLRIILRGPVMFETDTIKYFFKKMVTNFHRQEEQYRADLKDSKKREIVKIQMDVFYQMAERYFSSLELVFKKKDFSGAQQESFEEKMYFRKAAHLFKRKYLHFAGYKFMEVASNYGTSFPRWGVTSLIFILIFSGLFALIGMFAPSIAAVSGMIAPYDFVHFSVATFTTLGFGDIFPVSTAGKFIANLEVFVGFVMLGILIGMVQKKFL